MKSAVAYLRVSTKEQAERGGQVEGFSIPAQREALKRKAQSLNAVIVAEFVDAGESARSADRPELQHMLEYLKEHRVEYVLVHKVDRLARNRADDVAITMAIRANGAQLVSATENIDETPSGALTHGIMSSIAEFYSRNLAAEVHKGMSQKAKIGGTPGRAPLGYLNVGRSTAEGREERTVVVDKERAELIAWAFDEFASGDWTERSLANELKALGLTTRPTPSQPARPLSPRTLHSMLTNPYYKGDVMYRGVAHAGRHKPLVDSATWQAVQDVLAGHAAGEKYRKHHHYLKSSIFCGCCGSRLIVSHAKNRHGVIYPYFVCIGRQMKRTSCRQKALPIAKVEEAIEDHWATVQLDEDVLEVLRDSLRGMVIAHHRDAQAEESRLVVTRKKLTAKREKLVEAVYNGAMPMDLIAREQEAIGRQLAEVESRLGAFRETSDQLETHLDAIFKILGSCHAVYLAADLRQRRLLNQSLFQALYVSEDHVRADYAAPFDMVLAPEFLAEAEKVVEVRRVRHGAPADALTRSFALENGRISFAENKKPFGEGYVTEGLLARTLPKIAGSVGSRELTMAALRTSLSNTRSPLSRLLLARKNQEEPVPGTRFSTHDAIIADAGTTEPAAVRLAVKPNHLLKPYEAEQLLEAYNSGVSQKELARRFRVHHTTVKRHIVRRRCTFMLGRAVVGCVARKPTTKGGPR
ncbi:recombinase family protein [Amycolatopsis sp. CB00013]|uniref:recombinase family protein n=1 Tax=Amycolatopsis sp. CB00013 TaxID=1703945 RepID=UPI00093CAB59|nr:recombinase family protein [Amycolatopsis sp. CB00013]